MQRIFVLDQTKRPSGIRADGRFDIKTLLGKVTSHARNFTLLQRNDGYAYA